MSDNRDAPASLPADSAARGELALVRTLRTLLAPEAERGPVPFGDDMAAVSPEFPDLLWTTDMLMDGVDFEAGRQTWHDIGRKALAVNLSDCAAMAAIPVATLAAVSLQNALRQADAEALLTGIRDCGREFACPLLGGDTNSWDQPTVISVTVLARRDGHYPFIRRDGARPDDTLWVSGPIGGSLLGRHLRFTPRVALALQINRQLHPHAMIDISDGLALDLNRVVEASHCGAVLDGPKLEAAIHPDAHTRAAQTGRPALEYALHDGEDFELLIALPPNADVQRCAALGLRPIGVCTVDPGLFCVRDGSREPIAPLGWEHFR